MVTLMELKDLVALGADTSDCVQILYDHAVKTLNIRVLELGVRGGVSTLALLLAAKKVNGHLWSIDINPCVAAVKTVYDNGLSDFWTFMQGDDRKLLRQTKFNPMDLIFIDTSHEFEHTLFELTICDNILSKNGVMLLHDTNVAIYPGVMQAVNLFLVLPECSRKKGYVFEELGTGCGLGKLTKKD